MKYLIRHAHKENSKVHSKLSQKGITDSRNYGMTLKKNNIKISKIVTSPIIRCVETANHIKETYEDLEVLESTLLGNPGVFISDPEKAMNVFEKYNLVDIINMQLSNNTIEGFKSINIAINELEKFISSESDNTLFISHDAIITPFIYRLFNKINITDSDIVNYLEGYNIYEEKSILNIDKFMLL
jgi:broad specificity phosphatase PhoE